MFQLATYAAILGDALSGDTRIDALVATKDPQLVQFNHTPSEAEKSWSKGCIR